MTTSITKEQLRAYAEKKVNSLRFAIKQSAFTGITSGLEKELQLAEYALAVMDAELVAVAPDTLAEAFISAIEKEQDRLFGEDYLMDSKDCVDVIREEMERLNACRPAMLQAGNSPAIPDGWQLVPVIAFPSQWAAGQKALISAGINKVDAVYQAMVAAAPQQERK